MARPLAIFGFLAVAVPATGGAQDAQYWTHQYGPRANLLSGAVVGSVVDISATYYNPGALALIEDPDIFATSKVLEVSEVSLDPDLGVEVDLNDLRFDLAPGFVAGLLPLSFLGDHVLGYSIFTRHQFKADLEAFRSGTDAAIPPGGDFFGQLRLERDLNELWFGLSWSYPIRPRLGLGVTQFVAYRSQKGKNRANVEGLDGSGQSAISLSETEYSYYNYRLLWKAGLTFEWLGASLGLTLTTPSVNVFGNGKVLVNATQFGDTTQDTIFVAGFQDGISSEYRSSWAVALGGSYTRGSTTLHTNAEWFAEVDASTILDPDDFVGGVTGDTISFVLVQALDDVLNVGAGVDHRFSPTLSGFASFRTDFSAKVPGLRNDVAASSWDIYFITVGAAFRIGNVDLTLGTAYGFGGKKDQRLADLVARELVSQEQDELPGMADIDYRSLRLILAFAFAI